MELPETYVLLAYYKTLTPYVMLSNFPLLVVFLLYRKKFNDIEYNPFSLGGGHIFNIVG